MRFFVFLAGAAMALSYMVPWIEPPFAAPDISPNGVIGDNLTQLVQEGPWQAWVFLGGFALAALSALVALVGRASGLLSLLAGASPIVLGVHFYSRADELRGQIGLPFDVDFTNLSQAYDLLADFIRTGLYMYVGGAAVLLLAGLVLSLAPR